MRIKQVQHLQAHDEDTNQIRRLAPSQHFPYLCSGTATEPDVSFGSAHRPKEVVKKSPGHELWIVHRVDSVVDDVIEPEGGPE